MRNALAMVITVVAVSALSMSSQDKPTGGAGVETGRDLFKAHCASCHGSSGRGDGPAAASFTVPPIDLTQLAKANGGIFVADRIERAVDGRGSKAHGSIEMPVWGDVFKRRHGLEDDAVKARIEAIVRYLRSIQERSS
jgi:mono/diheme cytochrome c family protein